MSELYSKSWSGAVIRREDLYQKSKTRYAIRSILLWISTLSTAVEQLQPDLVNTFVPDLVVFYFHSSCLGLGLIPILKSELTTSNMMYLTAGTPSKEN